MNETKKRAKEWEQEVRKITTGLTDPNEPLAKSEEKENKDRVVADEPTTEEVY